MRLKDILELQFLLLQEVNIWPKFSQGINDCCFITAHYDIGHVSEATCEILMNLEVSLLIFVERSWWHL
jgi:hypothetical protein